MALINCPECGKDNVSDTAEMCPECGYGIKDYFIKQHQIEKNRKAKEQRMSNLQKELEEKLAYIDDMPYPEAPPTFITYLFTGKMAAIPVLIFIMLIMSIYLKLITAICGTIALFAVFTVIIYMDYAKIVRQYRFTIDNWENIKNEKRNDIIGEYQEKLKMALHSKNVVKYCNRCRQTGENVTGFGRNLLEYHRGYIFCEDSTDVCEYCGGQLKDTGIDKDDYVTIAKVSNGNRQLLEAMIDLKQKDIIEYELKMGQFRTQAQQQRASQKNARSDNTPKCPICNSTNLSQISALKKAGKIGLFGIFGAGDVGKTWQCNNCGSKF